MFRINLCALCSVGVSACVSSSTLRCVNIQINNCNYCFTASEMTQMQERTGPPGHLTLTRWAGWSARRPGVPPRQMLK